MQECGPIEEEAMVMQVLDHSFNVLILKLGVTQRVYCNVSNRNVQLSFVYTQEDALTITPTLAPRKGRGLKMGVPPGFGPGSPSPQCTLHPWHATPVSLTG